MVHYTQVETEKQSNLLSKSAGEAMLAKVHFKLQYLVTYLASQAVQAFE